MTLYDIALHVTDEVLGKGTYATINANNPDPGVKKAIARAELLNDYVTEMNDALTFEIDDAGGTDSKLIFRTDGLGNDKDELMYIDRCAPSEQKMGDETIWVLGRDDAVALKTFLDIWIGD